LIYYFIAELVNMQEIHLGSLDGKLDLKRESGPSMFKIMEVSEEEVFYVMNWSCICSVDVEAQR
jgi:hypothetical protein